MMIQTQLQNKRAITRSFKANRKLNSLFDVIVQTNGVELTEKLREAVSRKIGRVRQYAPRASRARVHFEREHMRPTGDQFRVMVRYEIPGEDIVAEHRAHEPLAALDIVAEKIERRLRKRKTARLASRVSRKARARRIADYCGHTEPSQHRR